MSESNQIKHYWGTKFYKIMRLTLLFANIHTTPHLSKKNRSTVNKLTNDI